MTRQLIALIALVFSSLTAQAASQMYYIHTDHLGTPQVLTDSDQQVVWEGRRMPFGELHSQQGTITQPLRFPGQYADPETGFHYNYFRDYDPSTGRYIQSDPIGLIGGLNVYRYVSNDPINRLDPLGLCEELLAYCRHPGTGGVRNQIAGQEVKVCPYSCEITFENAITISADSGNFSYDKTVDLDLPGIVSMYSNGQVATESSTGSLACFGQSWRDDAPVPGTSLTAPASSWSRFRVTEDHGTLYEILDAYYHSQKEAVSETIDLR